MSRLSLRNTTAISSVFLAILAASPAQAAYFWSSDFTYTGTLGASGGTTGSGAPGQTLSETDMTNAADNPATPIPAGGGGSTTAPINQALIQPGDQVILSQTVYGGAGGGTGAHGANGGNGGNGTSIQDWTENNAATTSVGTTAYGGNGGVSTYASGGQGGNAVASSVISVAGSLNADGGLNVAAIGGSGGNGAGNGGAGGTATAAGSGTVQGAKQANVTVTATGGSGGEGGTAFIAGASGNGGLATITNAYGASGSGTVNVSATQTGGTGGQGFSGSSGGTGANSFMTNVVSGSTTGALSLTQAAYGGAGGQSDTGANGAGGSASSNLGTITQAYTDTKASSFTANVSANGGVAGNFYSTASTGEPSTGTPPVAATATAYMNVVATGVTPGNTGEFVASSSAGNGGSSGLINGATVGGNATTTLLFTTTGSSIADVTDSSASASGGTGGAYSGSGSGFAANGGNAVTVANGNFNGTGAATSGATYNFLGAYADAGNGGTAYNFYFPTNTGTGGTGGTASAQASAASTTGQNLLVVSDLNEYNYGGNGGEGGAFGTGGAGGSYKAVNTVTGSTTGMLYLDQSVNGGEGGYSINGTGGNGGNAESDLTYADGGSASPVAGGTGNALASNLLGTVYANAGNGGTGKTLSGLGGNAVTNISLSSALSGSIVVSQALAEGGLGGYAPGTTLYSQTGSANATAFASGVRGTSSNTLLTTASAPSGVLPSSLYPSSAEATSGVGGYFNNDVALISEVGLAPGRAISQGAVAPTLSLNSTNAALPTTSTMGAITSATSTPYNFTEVGAGYMGAESNGTTGSNMYRMSAEYVLSSALVGSGNELLLGSASSYQNGTSEIGTGFDSLSLSITDKNSSGVSVVNKNFTTYSAFAAYIAAGVDLGNDVSGAQDVTVSMTEALSGYGNGASARYLLAVAPYANGGFTNQILLVQTPLPAGLPLFAVGLFGFGLISYVSAKRKKS